LDLYALLQIALTGTAPIHVLHQRFSREHALFIKRCIGRQAVGWACLGPPVPVRIPRLLSFPLAIVLILACRDPRPFLVFVSGCSGILNNPLPMRIILSGACPVLTDCWAIYPRRCWSRITVTL
jgi:hypothetical protein